MYIQNCKEFLPAINYTTLDPYELQRKESIRIRLLSPISLGLTSGNQIANYIHVEF